MKQGIPRIRNSVSWRRIRAHLCGDLFFLQFVLFLFFLFLFLR